MGIVIASTDPANTGLPSVRLARVLSAPGSRNGS